MAAPGPREVTRPRRSREEVDGVALLCQPLTPVLHKLIQGLQGVFPHPDPVLRGPCLHGHQHDAGVELFLVDLQGRGDRAGDKPPPQDKPTRCWGPTPWGQSHPGTTLPEPNPPGTGDEAPGDKPSRDQPPRDRNPTRTGTNPPGTGDKLPQGQTLSHHVGQVDHGLGEVAGENHGLAELQELAGGRGHQGPGWAGGGHPDLPHPTGPRTP